jgi:hypothetical protein
MVNGYEISDINNLPNEKWYNSSFALDYLISNLGRIKSCKFNKERIMRQILRKDGYLHTNITINGKTKSLLVHRLVCSAILGDYEHKQVNHKNGLKHDNRVENLEWVTHSENGIHSYKFLGRKKLFGKDNLLSKPIKCDTFDITFDSARIASKEMGVSKSSILNICNNKYSHINGLVFKYA